MYIKTLKPIYSWFISILMALCIGCILSCSKEGADNEDDLNILDPDQNEEDSGSDCSNKSDYVFLENDGLVLIEIENTAFSGDWKLKSNGGGFSGQGYLVWEGKQYFNDPGNGTMTFKIKIKNPGIYRFLWRSSVKMGNNGTEHNDSWLRFNDADDFFAKKNSSVVYPKGSGKSPNPEGSSGDGWFKIYRGGNDLGFKWQAMTYDNNAHKIYASFQNAGIYTMEVSARSAGHAIDKFVLFKEGITENDAKSEANESSSFQCN